MIYSQTQLDTLKDFYAELWSNTFGLKEKILIDYLLEKNQYTVRFLNQHRHSFDFKIYPENMPHTFTTECYQWNTLNFMGHVILPYAGKIKNPCKIESELSPKEKLFCYIWPDFIRYSFLTMHTFQMPEIFQNICNFLQSDDDHFEFFEPLINQYGLGLTKEYFDKHSLNEERVDIVIGFNKKKLRKTSTPNKSLKKVKGGEAINNS